MPAGYNLGMFTMIQHFVRVREGLCVAAAAGGGLSRVRAHAIITGILIICGLPGLSDADPIRALLDSYKVESDLMRSDKSITGSQREQTYRE